MTILLIYWFLGIPVYAFYYVYETRKTSDVALNVFLAISFCACVPVFREIVAFSIFFENYKDSISLDKYFSRVLFKKHKG